MTNISFYLSERIDMGILTRFVLYLIVLGSFSVRAGDPERLKYVLVLEPHIKSGLQIFDEIEILNPIDDASLQKLKELYERKGYKIIDHYPTPR